MRTGLVGLFLVALLAAQSAAAQSGPYVVPYGRSWPLNVAVDPTRGLAYFDAASGIYPLTGFSFGVVSTASRNVTAVFPLNVVPGRMAVDPQGNRVFVAGPETIEVFDGSSQGFITPLKIGVPILDIAFEAGTSPYLFLTSGRSVLQVDTKSGAIVGNATVRGGAGSMTIDPGTGLLYVADYLGAEVAVFRTSDLAPAGIITLPRCCPNELAISPPSGTLFATTRTNLVFMADLRTDSYFRSIQVSPSGLNSTSEIAADGETGRVFVSSSPGGSVFELDGSTGTILGVFRVDSAVAGMAVDASTGNLYVANYHQLTVFDARQGQDTLAFGAAAIAVATALVALGYLVVRRGKQRTSTGRVK